MYTLFCKKWFIFITQWLHLSYPLRHNLPAPQEQVPLLITDSCPALWALSWLHPSSVLSSRSYVLNSHKCTLFCLTNKRQNCCKTLPQEWDVYVERKMCYTYTCYRTIKIMFLYQNNYFINKALQIIIKNLTEGNYLVKGGSGYTFITTQRLVLIGRQQSLWIQKLIAAFCFSPLTSEHTSPSVTLVVYLYLYEISDKNSPSLCWTLYQHEVRTFPLHNLQSGQRKKREVKAPPFLHEEQIFWFMETFGCFADWDLTGQTYNDIEISSSISWSACSMHTLLLHSNGKVIRPVSLQVKSALPLYAQHHYQKKPTPSSDMHWGTGKD